LDVCLLWMLCVVN